MLLAWLLHTNSGTKDTASTIEMRLHDPSPFYLYVSKQAEMPYAPRKDHLKRNPGNTACSNVKR